MAAAGAIEDEEAATARCDKCRWEVLSESYVVLVAAPAREDVHCCGAGSLAAGAVWRRD